MTTPDPTVTITLDGDVTLPLFAEALSGLDELLIALSKQAGADSVEWVVDELAVGSAIATVRGVGDDIAAISQAAASVVTVGIALERQTLALLDPAVGSAARRLANVLDGVVPSLTLASGGEEVTVSSGSAAQASEVDRISAFGSLTGVVQTLSQARGFRFTIADETSGFSVVCRFQADQSETMRAIWGKRAIVEGIINRNRSTGRPMSVTDVIRVTAVREIPPGAFQRARGMIQVPEGIESANETIRRMRDAS
jgi:hypothetical protein